MKEQALTGGGEALFSPRHLNLVSFFSGTATVDNSQLVTWLYQMITDSLSLSSSPFSTQLLLLLLLLDPLPSVVGAKEVAASIFLGFALRPKMMLKKASEIDRSLARSLAGDVCTCV